MCCPVSWHEPRNAVPRASQTHACAFHGVHFAGFQSSALEFVLLVISVLSFHCVLTLFKYILPVPLAKHTGICCRPGESTEGSHSIVSPHTGVIPSAVTQEQWCDGGTWLDIMLQQLAEAASLASTALLSAMGITASLHHSSHLCLRQTQSFLLRVCTTNTLAVPERGAASSDPSKQGSGEHTGSFAGIIHVFIFPFSPSAASGVGDCSICW